MVYIGEYDVIVKTPGVSYGYSMVLSLLASLLAGGAAILIFIGNRMQPAGVQDGHVHPHTHDPDQLHFENQSSVVAQTAPRSARLPENGVQRPGSGTSDA
ncbi:hypothetical protein BaRGS_00034117 [Batillaria attramentaria]|uniref:Uncharacterized protein n=1 Tax=Batillaria attramentaria TaxID=370345 RepID=A0ABD0JI49_9CAEN